MDQSVPLAAAGLGKKYLRGWALRDCTLSVPAHRVVALVGPNGAGKSTLMGLATGMTSATAGSIEVFGERPGGRGVHPKLAFLGQHKPLYPQLTVAETLHLGGRMNPTWDQHYARSLVERAQVPLTAKVGTLSGGQRTRVALALALGKRPELVLLDEPLADLDPLARQQTLHTLVQEAGQTGITVVLSSHVLAELQGVCDHLVLLNRGSVQLDGEVAHLLAAHRWLVGPPGQQPRGPAPVVDVQSSARGTAALVRAAVSQVPEGWRASAPSLEDVVLAYMRSNGEGVAA
ncbi:ABC transporter ATP-binding protein [Kutzneria albida]|uniref:ABC transporter-like protein n=1 Tax=Kutzneria albida DSM 43870 TaxID=1449976 RepID=W5W6X1_9PSEU|nr:ABC transporter ATP-binding protein [Kutzneria albida]AHH96271.1 ABC transporter-like protein [Kutzneria albida DSM 43870]